MTDYPTAAANLYREAVTRLRYRRPFEAVSFTYSQIFNHLRELVIGPQYHSRNLFDEEWDLLVILDGCRVDAMQEVSGDEGLEFLQPIDTRSSPSGKSSGWMEAAFSQSNATEVGETGYVSANPHTRIVFERDGTVDESTFAILDEVWDYAWDDGIGTVPATAVTDRAIQIGREKNVERLIVHYMQPHFPSVPNPELGSEIRLVEAGEAWSNSIWERLLRRKVSKDEVWDGYVSNLRYVLKSVDTLLHNIDSEKVVISADHGNAFGERGYYGHGEYPIDSVRIVPWIETTADDTRRRQPHSITDSDNSDEDNFSEKLRHLGYLE